MLSCISRNKCLKNIFQGNGAYGKGNHVDKPYTYKGEIDAKFPSTNLKNLKYTFDDSFLNQKDDKGTLEYNGASSLTYNDDKKIKFDIKYKQIGAGDMEDLTKFDYTIVANLKVLDRPTLTFKEAINHDLSGEIKKMSENFNLKYGDKELAGKANLQWHPTLHNVNFDAHVSTPFEKLKKIDLAVDHKVKYKFLTHLFVKFFNLPFNTSIILTL